jgi:cardiolipin synthase
MPTLVSYTLIALYTLSVLSVVWVIISENRNPLKSMPWLIVLLLAPVVGLVFYFFFGHNLSKRRNISRRIRKQVDAYLEEQAQRDHPEVEAHLQPLEQLLAGSAHAVPLYDTQFTTYTNGHDKMESLLQAIDEARAYIYLQYYIIDEDRVGLRLRDALIRKAQAGVTVCVLYDDVGSRAASKSFFDQMRAGGVRVHEFLHVQFPRFTSKVNYRNHRKIVVIDGRIGFMGGMNIADRYVYGSKLGPWRDTHLRLEGGGVAGLQAAFINDWYATTRERLPWPTRPTQPVHKEANVMQLLTSGPLGKWRTLLQAVCLAIGRASHRIWIQTPYYLPSEALNNALQTAALAGIDVRLMLPQRSDARLVDLAVHSYLDDMIRAGVKVYFYSAGFIHAKVMLLDDSLTITGSANLDFRSFEHNFEVNAFIYDSALTRQLATHFTQDEEQCREMTASVWFHRPRLQRMSESIMRLFSPLL